MFALKTVAPTIMISNNGTRKAKTRRLCHKSNYLPMLAHNAKKEQHHVICATLEPVLEGKAYGDLTGRYPIMSNRGNNYIHFISDCDSNAILTEPLNKSRVKREILVGYRKTLFRVI